MKPITTVLMGVLSAFALCAPTLADDSQKPVRVQSMKGSLHLLQGKGGNVVASFGKDGLLLVDNDYADLGGAYEEALLDLTKSELAPGFVINTHWHFDHTGNNEYWGSRGSVIVAHANVRKRMSTLQEMPALGRTIPASPHIALPLVTYADSVALHFNGGDIEIQHYPSGHTDGDSVVYYSHDNVVHMGDLYFKDRFPFIDLGSGGSVAGYIANVEAVLARIDDKTLIVPGHGSIATKADLQRYLNMLKATSAMVTKELESGRGVPQILEQGLGSRWASWGEGFINEAQWIQTIAASQ